ncbi:MAG: methyltransferase domain-containing protein [Candidatus Viridilinea halotolerans]|uniref:Methyltransferase domain-containing protein n=1 Tax=Candidatus Viridilinea halotolerans TaxID=2491704 RepID=A0A426TZ93_9CHLR|nr:MAG: methyltransferase domain-containing protein [Candidatus Viridilinea halotolerans]
MDAYFKKDLPYSHRGQQFTFAVGHTLFSSFQVDEGSDLLLRTLEPATIPERILDLGCGVGILGITLARRFAAAQVVLADVNLLALRYARHNAVRNGVEHAQIIGSVGLETVPPGPYDLIVSNIPAKIGDLAIEQDFILGPLAQLRAGGEYWFVVVSGLNHLIPRLGPRHDLTLKAIKKRAGHTVYRLAR